MLVTALRHAWNCADDAAGSAESALVPDVDSWRWLKLGCGLDASFGTGGRDAPNGWVPPSDADAANRPLRVAVVKSWPEWVTTSDPAAFGAA